MMGPNTGSARPKIALLLLLNFFAPAAFAVQDLVDQGIAIVGRRTLSLRDLRLEIAIRGCLGDASKKNTDLDKVREEMVKRALIRNYLTSTGLMTEVADQQVQKERQRVRTCLKASDYKDDEVDQAAIDHMYEDAFLKQHLPSRVQLTDKDVRDYYEREKDKRFFNKPYASVEKIAREAVRREKQEKEYNTWVEEEMRRTEVLLLPIGQAEKSAK